MPILDTPTKRNFIKNFLIQIARTQSHHYWVKVDPRSALADIGLKDGKNRVKTLRNVLQELMPKGVISKSDIVKSKQTVGGFLAVALLRAELVSVEPSGEVWMDEIVSLQNAGA